MKNAGSPFGGPDSLDAFALCIKRDGRKAVAVKNYVGVITLPNGDVLEILPKIHNRDQDEDATRKLLVDMLRSLLDVPHKVHGTARLHTSKMTAMDVFVRMFIDEVQALVRGGLLGRYEITEENAAFCKGKLQVGKQLRYNYVHKERFYVAYDEFGVDNPENRLIKTTLEKLLAVTRAARNMQDMRYLLSFFENVGACKNLELDVAGLNAAVRRQEYKRVLQWCLVFLRNYSFTSSPGHTGATSLLFPMEKLFEVYVGRFLASGVWRGGSVSLQHKGLFLFESPANCFALRPDIVVRGETGVYLAVLDTKWKKLQRGKRNYGISQADMYQLFAYATKYKVNNVSLIYPYYEGFPQIESFVSQEGICISVQQFDLTAPAESARRIAGMLNASAV